MAYVQMLIGYPGVGKSTWTRNELRTYVGDPKPVVASSDNHIDFVAAERGLTYSEVFREVAKDAERIVKETVQRAIATNRCIIWDQTNLSRKTRVGRLRTIPVDYQKMAVVFHPPEEEEWRRRLDSRPGKIIGAHIIEHMKKTFQYPTLDEGFDLIMDIWPS